MREKQIESDCRHIVENYGGRMPKWVSPGNRGVPDRIVILPGYIAFVEFKRHKGARGALQVEWIVALRRLGHNAYIIESVAQFEADVLRPFLDRGKR